MTLPLVPSTCYACGACCLSCGRPPFPGFERDRMGQPCTALDPDTKLCTIYATRPKACRDVERGGVFCLVSLRRRAA